MALDAGVVSLDVVHVCGIQDVGARGIRGMLAARTVAAFADDIPLGNLFCVDVVVDRVAAVAGGDGGALKIIRGVERGPPARTVGYEVGTPEVVGDVPLGGLWVIVVADFGEVTLLPETAVNQSDVVFGELGDFVGGEVRDDRVGMFARVADYVGHGGLFPVGINLGVTFFTFWGANVVGGGCDLLLLNDFLGRRLAKIANEQDQLPTGIVGLVVGIAPCRHAGEANAVADDVVELTVGKSLGLRGTKIRNFRIEVAAHLGLAAAVAAVANGASVGEILVGLFQNIGRGLPGVGCVASTAG